jgi:hypothetical protein
MNKPLALTLLSALALAGCIHDDIYKPANPFNYKEVEWATKRGSNSISGKIERQDGVGKVYPCDKVWLAPDSAYNREMKTAVFGTTDDGIFEKKDARFVMVYSDWERGQTTRETSCGWKGHYSFERIPDGVWYLTAMGGPSKTGYYVQRRLDLRGNEKVDVSVP